MELVGRSGGIQLYRTGKYRYTIAPLRDGQRPRAVDGGGGGGSIAGHKRFSQALWQ
eukprot:SAG11_NODE_1063_length_5996_cov_2.201798_1_plen_55_part_10